MHKQRKMHGPNALRKERLEAKEEDDRGLVGFHVLGFKRHGIFRPASERHADFYGVLPSSAATQQRGT